MLLPWLESRATEQLALWSDAAGLDLLRLGTTAEADEIRDTSVAQPLLTAAALLSWQALGTAPDVVLGHSVGELAALAVAGVITPTDAVVLAAERGRAMAAAAAQAPTGMAATLGGDAEVVAAAAAALGLEVATVNVAGQTVYGGPVAALDQLAEQQPGGARVRRLETAGAFHTSAMAPAVPRLQELVDGLTPNDPTCTVIANKDGAAVTSGRELLDRLVGQLTGPVRFDLCLAAVAHATEVVELAPGGTLVALAKRAVPGAALTALKTPADLPVHA